MSATLAQSSAPTKDSGENDFEPKVENTFEIHVSNFPRDIIKADIQDHFASAGGIKSIRIIKRNNSAFGFIKFTDISSVEKSVERFNGSLLNDNVIKVAISDSTGVKLNRHARGVQRNTRSRKVDQGENDKADIDSTNANASNSERAATSDEARADYANKESSQKKGRRTKSKLDQPRQPRRPRPDGVEVDNQVFVKGIKTSTTDDYIKELFQGLTIDKINRYNNYIILDVPSKEVRDSIVSKTKSESIIIEKRRVGAKPAMVFASEPKEVREINTEVREITTEV